MNECHKCHKRFNSNRHLMYHLAFNPKHKDDSFERDDYTCPECDEDFDSKGELQEHIDDDHDDDDSIGDILGAIAGAEVIDAAFGDDSSDDNNDNSGDDFGGFSGGDMSGGGASSDW